MKTQEKLSPTAKYVADKNLLSWNMFKEHLAKNGVIENVKDEVPEEWNQAFLKACRGIKD